jgi:glycosyltransferase involved in cell wall biosynthesis
MARLLFVVHRYYPFPGGSEYYVADMAEEMVKRGHDVTVVTHQYEGDLVNGVKVTSDYRVIPQQWDLIIVHGGDCISQDMVHKNAIMVKSPVLYMIIKPSESGTCLHGLKHHRFLGYSTKEDIDYLRKHGVLDKARRVRHGIVPEKTIQKYLRVSHTKKTFVSAGGFYPHKAMVPLAEAFEKAKIPNVELVLFGYGEGPMPKETNRVKVFFGRPKEDVLSVIANADAYIMNSYEEGFGLVLLEAMMNKVPWFARDIAGAHLMKEYGTLYKDEAELMDKLRDFLGPSQTAIENAYDYVMTEHTIEATCNDIDDILLETKCEV